MSRSSRNRGLPGSSSGSSGSDGSDGSPDSADGSESAAPATPAKSAKSARSARSAKSGETSRAPGASGTRRSSGIPGPDGVRPGGIDPADVETAETMLAEGRMTVEGRLVAASNATLYCSLEWEGLSAACVYKPVAGERPLWDFPDGTLAGREVAAYLVSQVMGWRIVPPTVHRDGPYGPGMVQLWIEPDEDTDLVALSRANDPAIRRMAVFDAVVNNADRKIGHLLPPGDGHVFGCDHGVCFSVEYKLRTVLWQWRGKRLTDEAVEALTRLLRTLDGRALAPRLAGLITAEEVDATRRRIELMLKHRIHPYPPEDWPAIPWPPL